uniref:Small ribosomal subunit protein mS31 n=1 Tax=Lynceus sp. MCZ IZ 141354 TaxID=1930659 RepID=A0A9N6ZH44_9CRUS|nr:EOG090X04UC [Lynceus sp. MCZ IZ 141354]
MLVNGKPLNIFDDDLQTGLGPVLSTYDALQKKELKLCVNQPPRNRFEEMVQWTEQGKLWNFPIANEQGMDEERNFGFHEHVFLERHLNPWCPKRGPIRHFMELVCTGLSKNPYITVQQKKTHIEWFRKYFEEKRTILASVGALQDSSPKEEAKPV